VEKNVGRRCHERNTSEEKNGYIVLKLNSYGLAGKEGSGLGRRHYSMDYILKRHQTINVVFTGVY
jgi:hypothetical protein